MTGRNESGVILIALLWILTALSIIALSFSKESFIEVAAARNAQSLENSYFVARAGIASTTYQIIKKRLAPPVQRVEFQGPPDPVDIGKIEGKINGAVYQVNIQDESGKINLQFATEEQIRALVEASGIDKKDADIIVDSIIDWKDADSLHRLNGAEDDYYQSLNPPYKAKNGNKIDAIEELLLIKGITPAYFYGRPERTAEGSIVYKYGLSRYFTVYSTANRININYAPLAVLLSIPGMTLQAAQAIYERRQTKPFKTLEEIRSELPVTLGTTTLQYLSTEQTGVYTLTASAHLENSKVRRIIRTVISLDPSEKTQYRTLYWNENVPDYESVAP